MELGNSNKLHSKIICVFLMGTVVNIIDGNVFKKGCYFGGAKCYVLFRSVIFVIFSNVYGQTLFF